MMCLTPNRYRKFHLYDEDGTQTTKTPDLVTFRTDFNVTFGVFTCFDLVFHYPANALVERGVRNFVFPTMWYSRIPYLSGEYEGCVFNFIRLLRRISKVLEQCIVLVNHFLIRIASKCFKLNNGIKICDLHHKIQNRQNRSLKIVSVKLTLRHVFGE